MSIVVDLVTGRRVEATARQSQILRQALLANRPPGIGQRIVLLDDDDHLATFEHEAAQLIEGVGGSPIDPQRTEARRRAKESPQHPRGDQ
jgi:hypothetical protein